MHVTTPEQSRSFLFFDDALDQKLQFDNDIVVPAGSFVYRLDLYLPEFTSNHYIVDSSEFNLQLIASPWSWTAKIGGTTVSISKSVIDWPADQLNRVDLVRDSESGSVSVIVNGDTKSSATIAADESVIPRYLMARSGAGQTSGLVAGSALWIGTADTTGTPDHSWKMAADTGDYIEPTHGSVRLLRINPSADDWQLGTINTSTDPDQIEFDGLTIPVGFGDYEEIV